MLVSRTIVEHGVSTWMEMGLAGIGIYKGNFTKYEIILRS